MSNPVLNVSTGSERPSKRDELLRVATSLVDVDRIHHKNGTTLNGITIYKYTCGEINGRALKAAKDLIARVDEVFKGEKIRGDFKNENTEYGGALVVTSTSYNTESDPRLIKELNQKLKSEEL